MLSFLGRLAELAVQQQKRDEMSIPRALVLVTTQFVLPLMEEEEEEQAGATGQGIILGIPDVERGGVDGNEEALETPSVLERKRERLVVALSVFAYRISEGVQGGCQGGLQMGARAGGEWKGRHAARLALISVLALG
jgi:hypothetical protein